MKIKRILTIILLVACSLFIVGCNQINRNPIDEITIEEKNLKISELEQENSELLLQINNLTELIDSTKLQLDIIISEKTAFEDEINFLNKKIFTLEEEIKNSYSKEEIDSLKLQISSLSKEKESLLENIDKSEKEILQLQLNNLNQEINACDSKVQDLEKQISSLLYERTTLLDEVANLNSITQELQDNNKALDTTINDMNSLYNDISYIAMKANVKVHTEHSNMFGSKLLSQGSGVIFYEDVNYYYVLSNNHVVYDDPNYTYINYYIYDFKGNQTAAKLHSSDPNYDLAILYFIKGEEDLDPLPMSNIDINIGEVVVSIGQPKGQLNTISFGKVLSYKTITLTNNDEKKSNVKFSVIEHNGPINQGSSGGVLVNLELQIVGINFAGTSVDNNVSEFSYAIPLSRVMEYLSLNNFNINYNK